MAGISSDIDTLQSIYGGIGCRRPGGYSHVEFELGLERFARFLERYDAPATLFMVGADFDRPRHAGLIRDVADAGHEIANHTMSHSQGFRCLGVEEKEAAIAGMEQRCLAVTGRRPVGFRSPGWNVSDDALPILRRRGYRYDASVFPTSAMPALKAAHWRATSGRTGGDRSTMGLWRYMGAPTEPYLVDDGLGRSRRGAVGEAEQPFVEIPVTVTPVLRLPFFATWLVATGLALFQRSYEALLRRGRFVQFQFHLSDFVDYGRPELADQVPRAGDGVYVPAALRMSLADKLDLFTRAMDRIAADHDFETLAARADRVAAVAPRRAGASA